jgi:hypothetical protein
MRGAATAELLRWLRGFVATTAQAPGGGKADFEDLLLWAADLVRVAGSRYFQSSTTASRR